jgi:DNA adenine methylase
VSLPDDVHIEVRLIKSDDFEGRAYGVVLEPDLPDSQGDIVSVDEIQKASDEFMRDYLQPDVQHSGRDAGAQLVENYIAPADFTLGDEPITKGSWVQAYRIDDPVVKEEVRTGKLTGLSLEGTGERAPITI